MGLIPEQEHLTITDPLFEEQRAKSWPGMAHFAGTGPKNRTCRECTNWNNNGADPGYYAASGKHKGMIKPRSCARYKNMEGTPPAVPHSAPACKYFELDKDAPAIVQKW